MDVPFYEALNDAIDMISRDINKQELVPMQPGDVPVNYADTTELELEFGFRPNTTLRDGLRKFAQLYKDY